ncbi:MAG: restriction endonuclease [Melioribacteraceae bacterium]|nr:restriction endonuclease [Melioribacteraceae bacterium]
METITSQNRKDILVKKASGEEEPFDTEKLKRSLLSAGANSETISKIILDIECWIYSGVTTKKIYTHAFSFLRREKTTAALKYKLKRAILELGPTGYPFEKFIGKIFEKQGFSIDVGVVVDGNCVTHEMDVIATQNNTQHLMECKYHKDQGKQVSVQVPLYVRSRVNDIIKKRKEMLEYKDLSFIGWVVTNTRFSSDSIKFGTCSGLRLLAWDFPAGNGLKDIIAKLKVYPITILSQLKKEEKQNLLEQGIVTCSQLLQDQSSLSSLELSKQKVDRLIKELKDICN